MRSIIFFALCLFYSVSSIKSNWSSSSSKTDVYFEDISLVKVKDKSSSKVRYFFSFGSDIIPYLFIGCFITFLPMVTVADAGVLNFFIFSAIYNFLASIFIYFFISFCSYYLFRNSKEKVLSISK